MEPQQGLHMLEQVASGSVSPVDAQRSLADQGYSDLGFAKVDTDRARRTGHRHPGAQYSPRRKSIFHGQSHRPANGYRFCG